MLTQAYALVPYAGHLLTPQHCLTPVGISRLLSAAEEDTQFPRHQTKMVQNTAYNVLTTDFSYLVK